MAMTFLTSQFGYPRGWLGHLIGTVMFYENRERNRWAVDLLTIQPPDHLLEIGFGPGFALQQMAKRAPSGCVAGIDQSVAMVQQASWRNATAVREGRVTLQQGSATRLPYPDNTFDKVLAVNSLHHTVDAAQALKEVWRVLKPGGLVVVVEQPRSAASVAQVQQLANTWSAQLTATEFSLVTQVCKPMRPAASVGVLGTKVIKTSTKRRSS